VKKIKSKNRKCLKKEGDHDGSGLRDGRKTAVITQQAKKDRGVIEKDENPV